MKPKPTFTYKRKGTHFICAACDQLFEYDMTWSESEVTKERNKNFPNLHPDDACVICDECYQRAIDMGYIDE